MVAKDLDWGVGLGGLEGPDRGEVGGEEERRGEARRRVQEEAFAKRLGRARKRKRVLSNERWADGVR